NSGAGGNAGGQLTSTTGQQQIPSAPASDISDYDHALDIMPMSQRSNSSQNGSQSAYNNTTRHEKSLGLLTTKFVSLLQESRNVVLDLKLVNIISKYNFLQF